jgi:hypothetical protein
MAVAEEIVGEETAAETAVEIAVAFSRGAEGSSREAADGAA